MIVAHVTKNTEFPDSFVFTFCTLAYAVLFGSVQHSFLLIESHSGAESNKGVEEYKRISSLTGHAQ
jgi:hypothetical protein